MNNARVQENELINEKIFNLVNDYEHIDQFVDLHGQFKDFAVKTTR